MLLFWERGYPSVSIADLTEAMGIRPASLYAAFGNKAELYRSARARYFEREEPRWVVPSHGPLRLALAGFLDLAVRVVARPGRPRGCMIVSGFIEFAPGEEELATETRTIRDRVRSDLLTLFKAGQEAGELLAEAHPASLARYVATLVEGLSIQSHDGASVEELHAVCRAALRALPLA